MWFRIPPFEVHQRRLAWDLMEPGMTVLDIGANQGLYTVMASQKCGKAGRVFAFEPCCKERAKLRWNLFWNRCGNVVVSPEAVGRSEAKDLVLYAVVGAETGGNSLRPPAKDLASATKEERVGMTSVDSFCAARGIASAEFVKLDVEGGEMDVLAGAHRLLSSPDNPVILLEVSDARTAAWGYAAREIVQYLQTHGYIFFEIEDGILRRHALCEKYHMDLLAVPAHAIQKVSSRVVARGWRVE